MTKYSSINEKTKKKHTIITIPRHVAFILDGNRRWAKKNNLSINRGHKEGAKNIKNLCNWCIKYKIKYLTLYCLSTENLKRAQIELKFLYSCIDTYLSENNILQYNKNHINIRILGNEKLFSEKIRKKIIKANMSACKDVKLQLQLCIGYGGRDEIVNAVNKIVADISTMNKIENLNKNTTTANSVSADITVNNIKINNNNYANNNITNNDAPESEEDDNEENNKKDNKKNNKEKNSNECCLKNNNEKDINYENKNEYPKNKEQQVYQITEQIFEQYLYSSGIPDVDLLIRTGGDKRISNFLLWQISYAELYFCDKLWPEFCEKDFLLALYNFQTRHRNYGK